MILNLIYTLKSCEKYLDNNKQQLELANLPKFLNATCLVLNIFYMSDTEKNTC